MTCVLGMVVRREREIRTFVKTPFYRVLIKVKAGEAFEAEFRAVEGSGYFQSPKLYKENGFKEKEDAKKLVLSLNAEQAISNVSFMETELAETMKTIQKETAEHLSTELKQNNQTIQGAKPENSPTEFTSNNKIIGEEKPFTEFTENNKTVLVQEAAEGLQAQIDSLERKKENKYAPLLFNLAELQNECSRLFKISPDETLKIAQDLYEKKLVTYPRTDARVLSSAVAKEIHKNIGGLRNFAPLGSFAVEVMEKKAYQNLKSTRYVNDKQITDHYAIIPTGQGLSTLAGMPALAGKVYEVIARRFLSIFYPPAVYQKIAVVVKIQKERFFANFKVLLDEGYLKVAGKGKVSSEEENEQFGQAFFDMWKNIKKGAFLPVEQFAIKEGETSPPKRYNSGSLILAMENAGQLIEDEELRAQIKGSGIGTSATRAEILNKLVKINYLSLNKKTQVTTPSLLGELIFDVVDSSIRSLLNPELTASWEKGLTYVAEGTIGKEEYMMKLEGFVARLTNGVKGLQNQGQLQAKFNMTKEFY